MTDNLNPTGSRAATVFVCPFCGLSNWHRPSCPYAVRDDSPTDPAANGCAYPECSCIVDDQTEPAYVSCLRDGLPHIDPHQLDISAPGCRTCDLRGERLWAVGPWWFCEEHVDAALTREAHRG
jgi:hypothetical protein